MKEVVKHAWVQLKGFHAFIVISFALLIVGEFFSIATPYFFGQIVNELGGTMRDAYVYGFIAIGLLISSHITSWIREQFDFKNYFFTFSEKIEGYAVMRLMKQSMGQLLQMNSGVISETMGRGTGTLRDFVIQVLFNLIPHVLYVTLSIIAICLVSPIMGFSIFAVSMVYLYFSFKLNKKYEQPLLDLEEEVRNRGKFKSELLRNSNQVKLVGHEEWFNRKYMGEVKRVNAIERALWLGYGNGSSLVGFIRLGVTLVVIFLGIYLVRSGQETTGTMVMFISWSGGIVTRLGSIRQVMRQVARCIPTIQKYIDLVDTESDLPDTGTRREIPFGRISMSNVTYTYGRGNNRGIKDVTFDIEAGETVGIVGPSGAGKTTIIRLLTRAWDPTSGGIYFDNTPLTEYAQSYRQQIAFVQQEGQLFDDTIRFNLTFGVDSEMDDDLLWKALRDARLEERIKGAKGGLNALVGERGIKLSGGERQRLLIAQAILRKAKVLILDEATSQMDAKTEESIFNNIIRKKLAGVTTIIIAHRFATLKSCSRIMVMDGGRLIAFDSHSKLMQSCEIYRELVKKQGFELALN